MSKTVVGLFDTIQEAQNTVSDLVNSGIPKDRINVVAQNTKAAAGTADIGNLSQDTERVEKGEAVTTDAIAGALFGGVGGALIGVLALAIPGLGPLIAAGPIAATLAGITAGAAGGAAIGALQTAGITEKDAHVYAESIRRGSTVVAVHAEEADVDRVRQVLDQHGAVDIDQREESYRQAGWQQFDENAPAYTAAGAVSNRDSVAHTGYVGETDRSPTQVAPSAAVNRTNPTDTTIMTTTENVPRPSSARSKVYDHLRT